MKHAHMHGIDLCRRCGLSWCGECLVYAYGPSKPPYCMECAMYAGGVRSVAPRPAMAKRELKARLKAVRLETKVAAQVGGAPQDDDMRPDGSMPEVAALTPANSWETPWWEDQPQGQFAAVPD